MKLEEEKIGFRGLASIITITIGLKLTDMTPNLFLPNALCASWMVPLISSLVTAIPLFFMIRLLQRYRNKGLVEIAFSVSGRWIGFLLSLGLWIIAYSVSVTETRSYAEIMHSMYFPATPLHVFQIVFLIGGAVMAYRGLANISYTSWIIFPYVKIAMLFLIALILLKPLNWDFLFPLMGGGVDTVLIEGVKKEGLFGDLLMAGVLYPYVKSGSVFTKGILVGGGIGLLELVVFLLLYIVVFDYAPLAHMLFPFHQVTRFVNISRFLTNMEAIFLIFWLAASFVKIAFYIYLAIIIFAQMLGLKDYKIAVLPTSLLIFFGGTFFSNAVETELVFRDRSMFLFTIYLSALMIFLWIGAAVRGKKA